MPAAGHARRLPGLDRSKEILPVGEVVGGEGRRRPKAVCEYLLEALALAGIERGLMVLRAGKEDVSAYLDGLPARPLDLTYPVVEPTPSVPHTLDVVRPLVAGSRVALGFPDILIRPASAFAAVRERQQATGADLVLGLFPTRHPERADMVELDAAGRPQRLRIKERGRGLRYTWSLAIWTPAFTELIHAEVARAATGPGGRELYVGDIVQSALERGFAVEAVPFPEGDSLDIGEPEGLALARRLLSSDPGG